MPLLLLPGGGTGSGVSASPPVFTYPPPPPILPHTGDQNDMVSRLFGLLPSGWFTTPPYLTTAPVIAGVVTGIANGLAYIYSLYLYAVAQSRIRTAFGQWLDLIAWDYFGPRFIRTNAEPDAAFQSRILAELLRPRDTAAAIATALQQTTTYPARVIEPNYPNTTGSWGNFYWGVDSVQNPGRWVGSNIVDQFFVLTPLPALFFGPNAMPCWGQSFYWGVPRAAAWFDPPASLFGINVVYNNINATRAAGTTAWVQIIAPPPPTFWDEPNITWDQSGIRWQ